MNKWEEELMQELGEDVLEAIFDPSMSYEELEELLFSTEEENSVDLLETWLERENISYEQGLKQREAKKKRLLELGEQLDFPLDSPYKTCKQVSTMEEFTGDLEEFLTLFLSEQGNLLQEETEISEKEQLTDYAFSYDDYQETKHLFSVVVSLQQNWKIQKSKFADKSEKVIPPSNVEREELVKIYASVFRPKSMTDIFQYNLDVLLEDINGSDAIRKIAPLYIYQAVVKHNSRLHKNQNVQIDIKSLWTFKKYEINEDNGKNFTKNRQYLSFFERLCTLFEKDTSVNISLSRWGFAMISNLVEFQRSELEDKLEGVFPYLDKILEVSFFSAYGEVETVAEVLKDTGYSRKQVSYFQSTINYRQGLEKVALYMNENPVFFLETWENEDFRNPKNLCIEILKKSKLKKEEKPNSQRELDLYLCSINIGLLDIQDYFAKEYLVLGLLEMFRKDS